MKEMNGNEIRFADVFSGIGGFRLGLEKADSRYKCVWSCELDKFAKSVYNHNFGEDCPAQDIREVKTEEIPDIDMLVGGFPCQSFSIAGSRGGLEDTRGTLFFELCRILQDKKPKYYLFENVQNLLHHNGGNTFATVIKTLWELGYTVEWQVCNLRDFGLPQNRERIFIAGHLRGESCPQIFPIQRSERVYISPENGGDIEGEWFWGTDRVSTLTRNYRKGVHCGGEPYIITNHVLLPEDYIPIRLDEETGETYSSPWPRHDEDELLGIICPHCGEWFGDCDCLGCCSDFDEDLDSIQLRRFTPMECERIQGFPDKWTAEGREGKISDSQRYGQLGNSVPVPIIQAIGEKLIGVI